MQTDITPRLVKPSQAAAYLAISDRTLWQLSRDGVIPAVKLRRSVRYDIADLNAFIQKAKGL